MPGMALPQYIGIDLTVMLATALARTDLDASLGHGPQDNAVLYRHHQLTFGRSSMPTISTSPTIKELQDYVAAIEVERGFADQSVVQKCLLLGEEVGELFKAVRTCSGIGVDPQSSHHVVADELADVLIFLVAIANRAGVDLATAFLEKEARNDGRVWQRQGHPNP